MQNQMFVFLVHHGKLKPFPWKVSMVNIKLLVREFTLFGAHRNN